MRKTAGNSEEEDIWPVIKITEQPAILLLATEKKLKHPDTNDMIIFGFYKRTKYISKNGLQRTMR